MKRFSIVRKIIHYLNLEAELDDFDRIHESITKDIVFKGTNLWILMFAIIIASVGLNMNSAAVIIGAMLISPLMGPINGMGYSIATYDFPLFRKALKNFTFAVIVSLVASTGYFALTPISTAHSELLARTSPTIYDVLIALFGGLAGIVAINSKQKGNVIPGVAIATALMPPLCTAGFGLGTGQFHYFFGAFYLFTINTVFIALSSVAISQILKFPIRTALPLYQKKKINRWITLVILLMLIPSIYFGYNLVQKEKFTLNASRYLSKIGIVDGNYLLKNEINPSDRTITLVYAGASLTESQKNKIVEEANDFSLRNVKIFFKQGLSFDALVTNNTEKDEINRLKQLILKKESQIDSLNRNRVLGQQIFEEISSIFPQIESCSYSETFVFRKVKPASERTKIILFGLDNTSLSKTDKDKILEWLKRRLKTKEIKVYYVN